jgi:hypothetical protein
MHVHLPEGACRGLVPEWKSKRAVAASRRATPAAQAV